MGRTLISIAIAALLGGAAHRKSAAGYIDHRNKVRLVGGLFGAAAVGGRSFFIRAVVLRIGNAISVCVGNYHSTRAA